MSAGFAYAAIEAANNVVYREYERVALEELFIEKADSALFVEGWGDFYLRSQPRIHQVHSRGKSTVVPANDPGRDGAVQFYFREKSAANYCSPKFFGPGLIRRSRFCSSYSVEFDLELPRRLLLAWSAWAECDDLAGAVTSDDNRLEVIPIVSSERPCRIHQVEKLFRFHRGQRMENRQIQ